MSQRVLVPDTVDTEAERLAEELDMSKKEAIRHMCQEGGFDV
jgi:hypothetical protein